jgi:hypothetical protein
MSVVLSENTSKIGKPEISFTLNKDPLKVSVTENNSPCDPCTVNTGWVEPEPNTVSEEPDAVFCELDMIVRDAVTLNKRDSSPNHNTVPFPVLKCGLVFADIEPVEAYNWNELDIVVVGAEPVDTVNVLVALMSKSEPVIRVEFDFRTTLVFLLKNKD